MDCTSLCSNFFKLHLGFGPSPNQIYTGTITVVGCGFFPIQCLTGTVDRINNFSQKRNMVRLSLRWDVKHLHPRKIQQHLRLESSGWAKDLIAF